MKNTITKWLLKINHQNELTIIPQETSMYAPINRILDTVVFFALDSMNVNKTAYIIVYDPNEEDTVKTRI